MNTRQQQLWLRRQSLLSRSAELRQRLVVHSQSLSPALGGLERVRSAGRWLRQRPWISAFALAILVVQKPSRVWRWTRRAWLAWKLLQNLRDRTAPDAGIGRWFAFMRR